MLDLPAVPRASGNIRWIDHRPGYRDLDYYAEIARTLERRRFNAFFSADIHGPYDTFRVSRDAGVQHAVQFPCNDPTVLLLPALATQHLSLANTYSAG